MPVTELAILPFSQPLPQNPPHLPATFITQLSTAKERLTTAAGFPFHFFQQVEDPSIIYTLGPWSSIDAHSTFIASKSNQDLLELLNDTIRLSGPNAAQMWHLEPDVFAAEIAAGRGGEKSVFGAPVVSVGRHFVAAEKREAFAAQFEELRGLLDAYISPRKVVGGWRVEKEVVDGKEREEFVLFAGFESVEKHMAFMKTPEFEKYKGLMALIDGFEVKHMKAISGL